jgi:hypothetical protein
MNTNMNKIPFCFTDESLKIIQSDTTENSAFGFIDDIGRNYDEYDSYRVFYPVMDKIQDVYEGKSELTEQIKEDFYDMWNTRLDGFILHKLEIDIGDATKIEKLTRESVYNRHRDFWKGIDKDDSDKESNGNIEFSEVNFDLFQWGPMYVLTSYVHVC